MVTNSARARSIDAAIPYGSGQRIPYSGVYRVQHHEHRPSHLVTVVQGEFFPACRVCGLQVRFTAVHTADLVREDYDFSAIAGPQLVVR
jgi:hypothetical protein